MEDVESVNKAVEYLERAQDALFDKFYSCLGADDYVSADKCLDLMERLQLF